MSRVSTQGLTAGVRRALTFWRRSIQARVVASTLVLSAVVVSVVGWFLLQQTRDGLLDQRVDAVVAEARGEVREAEVRLDAASGLGRRRDPAAARPGRPDHRRAAGPRLQRGARRARAARGSTSTTRRRRPHRRPRHGERAGVDGGAIRRVGATTAWTYTRIVTDERRRRPPSNRGSWSARRSQLPADGQSYTLYFLFPLEEQEETLGAGDPGAAHRRRRCCWSWSRGSPGWSPVRWSPRSGWPGGWPSGWPPAGSQERLRVSGEDDLARLATSFNQMASNLQRQIRQLEELSRVQRRFVSDVSHELRTPLTTVRMAGDVLHDAREGFDPATARAAELLQTELDRFETLLVDLLEISRFDAGAAVLDADDVNLVDVAHRVVEATQPLADQRGVRVRVEAPDHACLAEADQRRVERIVRNLVTNAIDHAEAGGGDPGVVVRLDSDDHAAAVAVRDYGVGLGAGGVRDGVQPVLAGRPGPGPHQRRHRARAVDLAGGHPPARRLAAGLGPPRAGRAVPADPAAARRRRAAAQPAAAGAPGRRRAHGAARRLKGAPR